MPRALLLLLVIAVLGAGWLLKDTLLTPAPDEASTADALDAEASAIEGEENEGSEGAGPGLAMSGTPRTHEGGPAASETHKRAQAALGSGPPPATVHFVGTVKDAAGNKLGDVEIVAVGENGSQTFRTNKDGAFERTLAAGRYDLLFRDDDRALLRRNFRVDGALTEDTEFTLRDTGVIVVTVLRGDEPVPGVPLEAVPDGQFQELLKSAATTGADGQARLESLPAGRYTLTGDVPEGPKLVHRVTLGAGSEKEAVIRLPQGVQLSGTVRVGKDGPAVPNARIELQVRASNSAGNLVVEFETEADGTFDHFVPRGRPTSFRVEAPGFAPFPEAQKMRSVLRALRRLTRDKPVKYDVALDAGLAISGLVIDTEEQPVPQVMLDLRRRRDRESMTSVTSDGEGRFVFPNLAPDTYDLGVVTAGLFPTTETRLRIRLGNEPIEKNVIVMAARRVSGKVVRPTGEGVPAARVWVVGGGIAVRSARDAGRMVEAYTSNDGSFLLTDLPTDRGLSIRASMGLEEASPISIGRNDEYPAPVRLVLEPTGEIHGTVVDLENRQPLANVFVDVRPDPYDGRTRKTTRTTRDGTFRVRGLIPGRWRLTPRLRGYLVHEGDLVDVQASELEVGLELDPGVVFAGLTVTEDGKPLGGANVVVRKMVDGKRVGRWTGRSDGRGRFRVSGVERNAEYYLAATRGGYIPVTQNGLRSGQNNMRLSFRKRGR